MGVVRFFAVVTAFPAVSLQEGRSLASKSRGVARLSMRAGAALAVSSVLLVSLPVQAGQDTAGSGCAAEREDGSWISTPVPLDGQARALLADRVDPARLYAADDRRVLRTTDGGCAWRELFELPAGQQLRAAVLTVDRRLVLAAVTTGAVASPRVYAADVTEDRPDFAEDSRGLPPTGEASALAAAADGTPVLALEPPTTAPTLPQPPPPNGVVPLTVEPVVSRLYAASREGGWRPLPATGLDEPVQALATDPASPRVLWVAASNRLLGSTDAGASFRALPTPVGDVAQLSAGAPDALAVVGTAGAAVSRDAWRQVQALPAPGDLVVAGADEDGLLVRSTGGRLVSVRGSGGPAVDVTPPSGSPARVLAVAAPRRTRPGGYLVLTDSALLRARPPRVAPTLDPTSGDPLSGSPGVLAGPPPERRGRLVPERQEVVLASGTTRSVPLTLDIPATPTPVDLFFLVDTSDSMTPVLDDLRSSVTTLVERLTSQGVSLHVGLATTGTERRDGAADPPLDPLAPGYAPPQQYRLLRAVGPPDAQFRAALDRLRPETPPPGSARRFNQLAGAWQALTGSGIAAAPGGSAVPAGGAAGWRQGDVRRIVVDATDTSLRAEVTRGTPQQGGQPDLEAVAAELRVQRVAHLGLVLDSQPELVRDLGALSTASGALAGADGVDCDGDGRQDLPAGAPLVCVTTSGFTSGVAAALRALPDLADLDVRLSDTAAAPLVRKRVDVLSGSTLPIQAPLACAAGEDRMRAVDITARLSGGVVAAARIDLRCVPPVITAVPAAPAPVPVPVEPVPQAAVPLPPAPQPPAPPAQPIGQPQPVGQPGAQPAAAAQEEEQAQLALAGVDLVDEQEVTAAGNSGPSKSLAPFTAALVTMAAGYAAMRRTSPQVAGARR
jgi:hypothetical protein